MAWTKELLKQAVEEKIGSHKFIVVSNREPYLHIYTEKGIDYITPASGMTVALDPVIRACGGTWIASGAGEADRDVVDENDHVRVPPDAPCYTLRRVWLSKEEEERFYYGYSNEGLWPLCHIVHVRPIFREKDWEGYQEVNQKFAAAVLEEVGDETGFVFIQDYHFALLPQLIKEKRPDIIVAQFWHIPWPNPEAFRVCPHAEEILNGLLGNDILGFHIRYHCQNFLDSVDRFLESRVDTERQSVVRGGRETLIRPFPISIDAEMIEQAARHPDLERRRALIRTDFKLKGRLLGVGIDRLDYTKGIIERFEAIDRLFEKHPELLGRFVFLQIGPLSRIHIARYRAYNEELYDRMIDINDKWKSKDWRPIILHKSHFGFADVLSHFRAADVLIVSSIHDGMNLVAKEFVAARSDERGALVLSKFTGSARELDQAILVNPLATEEFADAIYEALTMSEAEQAERMRRMRETVLENNVYRWAGRIINEMRRLV
ncbi:MAG: trehalose-6-phosphate synthase [Candidatus Aminicenantes bacterium]|nr:trehalose-6-phosphate synthase [Candidatus Aminicenantes bacterium]